MKGDGKATGIGLRILLLDEAFERHSPLMNNIRAHDDATVVGLAKSATHTLSIANARTPQVILHFIDSKKHLQTLHDVQSEIRVPIVVVTDNDDLGREALKAGAVDTVRPETPVNHVLQTLALMSSIPVVKRREHGSRRPAKDQPPLPPRDKPKIFPAPETGVRRLVVIGASTGGPNALATLLARLTKDFPAPVLVAQHMPDDFPDTFADWLNSLTELTVKVAATGMEAQPGHVYISPAQEDLLVTSGGFLHTRQPIKKGPRPSVDRLFNSAAQLRNVRTYGVLLTGMGKDGAKGLANLRENGAETVVQDRDSSAVFSMPQAALEIGAAQFALAPNIIGDQLSLWALGKTKVG